MWIIRNSNGRYVAKAGSSTSFTTDPLRARRFTSKSEAERHCCGNERLVTLRELIGYCF